MRADTRMRTVKVKGKTIGDGRPAYIIAEVGINHGGDAALAKEMIQAAWESGADAVKIQTFLTREFLRPEHPGYKSDLKAELSRGQEQELWDFAKKNGVNLFSTPEEFKSLEFIKKQNPALIKIAAMDFNYKELIQAAASLQKPIILSSGMSNLEETIRAVRWVEETGNNQHITLHCVSCYPAYPESLNLRTIETLKKTLNSPVGFSDHTIGCHLPLAAVAMGANVIEKHFTLDRNMKGPDHKSSIDPAGLKVFISQVRELESAMGTGVKEPAKAETEPRIFKRRGIYAAMNLASGETINREKVLFYAPSVRGSSVDDWPMMEGRKLITDIPEMSVIRISDIKRTA